MTSDRAESEGDTDQPDVGIEREWRYVLHPKITTSGRVFDTRHEAIGERSKLNRRKEYDLKVTAKKLIPNPGRR